MRQNYELINHRMATPQRLHALVRLVARLDNITRQQIVDYLQPGSVTASQEAAETVYLAARNCQLIQEDGNQVRLHGDLITQNLDSAETFRRIMQDRLLGVVDANEDNYLLNIFTAWYAAQDSQILQYESMDEIRHTFNQQMYPQRLERGVQEGEAISQVKFRAWRDWASFLGWGWLNGDRLMPDAYIRVQSKVEELAGRTIGIGEFISKLADQCPELDQGALFLRAWGIIQPHPPRQRISLMLSTALRSLHIEKAIKLLRRPDARDLWKLHKAEGFKLEEISHIEICEG